MSIPLRRIVIAMILVLPGCVLLPGRRSDRSRPTQSVNRNRVTRNTVELDVVAIERAVADPLSTQLMWDDLDESGVFDPPVRKALNQNGFRIGVAGSQLPDSIQTMLRAMDGGQEPREDAMSVSSSPLTLFPGERIAVDAQTDAYPACAIREIQADEASEVRDYQNARCVLEVKARKLQEGWAVLEFLPVIYHGQAGLRPVADETGWRMPVRQKREELYHLKFEIRLNLGEAAVISAADVDADSVGHHFFVGVSDTARNRRLLIVRLADLSEVEGVRQDRSRLITKR